MSTNISSYILIIDLAGAAGNHGHISVLRRFEHHRLRDVNLANGRTMRNLRSELGGAMEVDDSEGKGHQHTETYAALPDVSVSPISLIATSLDSQWLATADLGKRVHLFNLDTIQVRLCCQRH